MWYAILLIVLAVTLAGLLYLSFRAARLPVVRKLTRDRRWLARTLCLLGYGALLTLLWRLWNGMNAIICLLHLVLFQAAADLVDLIRSKLRRKPRSYGLSWAAALLLCVLYLGAGWHADHAVRPTFYSLETNKFQGDLRIVQIADAHVGTTFSGDGLMGWESSETPSSGGWVGGEPRQAGTQGSAWGREVPPWRDMGSQVSIEASPCRILPAAPNPESL